MAEESPNDLNFGHFGVPAYELNNSHWAFARTVHGTGFRQLGQWKIAIPAAVHFALPPASRKLRPAQQATNSLIRDLPELVPASDYVSELEAVSAAATAALNIYDPTIGQLMSFGTITPPKRRAAFTRQVVALPTSEGGNILRLQLLTKERHGWRAEEHTQWLCYLEGLSVKGGCGFWNEDATAIQQVCFAEAEESGSFLAIRLPQRVVLFDPVYHRRTTAAPSSRFYDLPASIMDIRPFHSVWAEDTGNIPHADVSFNPHYQRQFAIVDQDSNWSVWDIDGNRRGYSVTRVASGTMKVKETISDNHADTAHSWKNDGWARIMWVGDANTILICNRRCLELVDLKNPTCSLQTPQVIDWSSTKNPSRDWILDMKRDPTNEKQFFVLTSARLYLFSVTSLNDERRANLPDAGAAIVLSWTHFRGTEDVTLQLYVQSASDEELALFIHSRLNALITVYHLVNQPSTTVPCCSSGPTTLRLDSVDNTHSHKVILNFAITPLEFKDSGTGSRGSGHDYIDRGVQFYQLSALFSDLSVAQTMLCSVGPDASRGSLQDVEPISWTSSVRPPAYFSAATISNGEDDLIDFIEPDGPVGAADPLLKPSYRKPKSLGQTTTSATRKIAFTDLYEALISNPLSRANASPGSIDILALVDGIKQQLDRQENAMPFTLGTLQEYAEAIVTVEDIDDASAMLQELYVTEEGTFSLELQRIASDHVLGFGSERTWGYSSLSSFYDSILQNWVAPLPGIIPARVRQSKERMARQIATGVVLASTQVRRSPDHAATQLDPTRKIPVALSSSPQYSSQSDWQSQSSQPADSDSLIAPLPPRTPFSSPLERLSKHLHINPRPLEVAPSINQVLSHWQLGTDPSAYDWEASERAYADELELEQEDTRKRREKARRKKERQVKRQRKENQLFMGRVESGQVESQPQMLRSSPGPAIPASSSQAPALSQSQPFFVQSQVEPGKHGGKPNKKKKVKSRMSGF